MSRKARHNEKVRARILAAAGEAFRRDGYDGTGIDRVMAAAGLTRGAFYAHFASKEALFAAAIGEDDLLLRLLRGRSTAAPGALAAGMAHVFRTLLDPTRQDAVRRGWGLPHLMREAALGPPEARAAYGTALAAIRTEMARGLDPEAARPTLDAALAQTCGAIAMAAACACPDDRACLLRAAGNSVADLLGPLAAGPGPDDSARGASSLGARSR